MGIEVDLRITKDVGKGSKGNAMNRSRFAIVSLLLSVVVTLWLISEAFIPYVQATTAREVQQMLQVKILAFGSLAAVLQLTAGWLLIPARVERRGGNSQQ